MSYLGILLLLSLLIVIHEAGHLLAARWAGIPVTGFSVGFGPKLWKRRWGQVEYSLRWFPLGGFVMPADEPEFSSIPLRKRLVFYLGGPVANLAAALLLFAVLNAMKEGVSIYQLFVAPFGQVAELCGQILTQLPMLLSKPDSLSGVVGIVVQGSQAAAAGMGLYVAIWLSISLAVLNLLPLPILDGGQIVMSCLEEVFPRFARLRVPLTLLGLVFLAAVMVYANARDVVRYFP